MPVGLQLIGRHFDEGTLLHAAHALQQATDFHLLEPPGSLRSPPPTGAGPAWERPSAGQEPVL
jgi:hypothetical protein